MSGVLPESVSHPLILVGDAVERLRELPSGCVHMCVTSPPFYGLRDYGVDGQIGLEQVPTCDGHGLMRLRSDLTEDQRAFVLRRLAEEGRPGA